MNPVEIFTSTGNKLIHNWKWIRDVKENNRIMPLAIECAPESRCNLKCSYCSNKDRKTDETLDADFLLGVLEEMRKLGTKTIQWTGGGEFLIHPDANKLIIKAAKLGYKQGLITNGTMFHKLDMEAMDNLTWIRISLNREVLDKIVVPEVQSWTTVGFSCVMTDDMSPAEFAKIEDFVSSHNPKYVRIVTNCLADDETQKNNNIRYSRFVESLGSPYFYQPKEFRKPERCWWSLVKPFLHHDGYYYPCSSVVLNPDSDGHFHSRYRLGKIKNLVGNCMNQAVLRPKPFKTDHCDHCVFFNQNQIVDFLINPNGMEEFV